MKSSYFLILFFLFTGSQIYSQTGNLRGVIVDEFGINVPGAAVMLPELNKGTTTDQEGIFTLVGIPAGTQNLVVTYLGYEDIRQEVAIQANTTTRLNLNLVPSAVALEDVQIVGLASGGQARALNTQKTNINITNVVSTDQIGKFPDANIGDAARRIPGITMQVDQGESRNIIVRGLAPQLNSVTLNGSRIPSAEGDNRNIQMDLIPSDMIQTIEVSKAVTPAMDADALGGSVNLVTRTTPQDFRLSATAGSGINFITDKRILTGSFLLGDRSKDNKFGWMVSASINDNDFGSDNAEAEWSNEFAFTNASGEEEEIEVNPYANVFETRKYLVQRVRRSFSLNFDYNIDANNTIFVKTMYNWRDDRENRFASAYEVLDAEDIGPDDFTLIDNTPASFPVASERETKGGIPGGRIQNRRLEDQRMQNYSIGGDHLFGKLKFDWMQSYARASEERPNERYIIYESEFLVNNDFRDTREPFYSPVDDITPADYEFGELTEENQFTEEEDVNVFLNFELPADFFGYGGSIQFGARGRFKEKVRDNDFYEFEPQQAAFENLENINNLEIFDGDDFLAGEKYRPGFFVAPDFLGSLDLFNEDRFESELLQDEFLTANFDVSEDVYAGYAMTTQNLSDRLSVLAGLRVEHTRLESTGNEIIFNEDGDFDGMNVLNGESSYTNILPGLHFKYNVTDNTILRLAWTNTLARPNYEQIVPFREFNREDEEILVGNPELKPTTSMNFDLMAEHYFRSVGILSGGVFYKDLTDFIYTFITEDDDTGFDLFQPLNGDKASIYGAEVALQRQLDFLPGFAKNFGIYANYTYIYSSADGVRNEDGDARGELDLPGATPHMFNASLSYGDNKFSARLSANFSDAYLDELGGNAFEDRYYDKQFFLDFNVTYALYKNLRIFADLNNITNQPLRYYQGVESRTMQMEFYERRLTFGLKYDLY